MSSIGGKRALVTGATGFIGTRLVGRLLVDGWVVHVITRSSSSTGWLARAGVVVHVENHTVSALEAAVEAAGPNVVFHLAGYFVANHLPTDVGILVDSNVAFGVRLTDALARTGTAPLVVNAGTFWQHVDSSTYRPAALYAATKQAFEDCLQYYADAGAIRAVTLKLSDTYGPDDPRPKVLNLLLAAAASGTKLDATAGEQYVDLVHVDDVADAFMHAASLFADRDAPCWLSFAVSSGCPVTIRELAATMEEVTGRQVPVAWGARPYRDWEMFEPWHAGEPLPGWSPRVTLHEGLSQLGREMADLRADVAE